jgi:hypothetical protein
MGFALWIQNDVAWAKGTHEYRPMGVAVIGVKGRFRPRDFHRYRTAPSVYDPSFVGFFASVGHLNERLESPLHPHSGARRKRIRVALPDV